MSALLSACLKYKSSEWRRGNTSHVFSQDVSFSTVQLCQTIKLGSRLSQEELKNQDLKEMEGGSEVPDEQESRDRFKVEGEQKAGVFPAAAWRGEDFWDTERANGSFTEKNAPKTCPTMFEETAPDARPGNSQTGYSYDSISASLLHLLVLVQRAMANTPFFGQHHHLFPTVLNVEPRHHLCSWTAASNHGRLSERTAVHACSSVMELVAVLVKLWLYHYVILQEAPQFDRLIIPPYRHNAFREPSPSLLLSLRAILPTANPVLEGAVRRKEGRKSSHRESSGKVVEEEMCDSGVHTTRSGFPRLAFLLRLWTTSPSDKSVLVETLITPTAPTIQSKQAFLPSCSAALDPPSRHRVPRHRPGPYPIFDIGANDIPLNPFVSFHLTGAISILNEAVNACLYDYRRGLSDQRPQTSSARSDGMGQSSSFRTTRKPTPLLDALTLDAVDSPLLLPSPPLLPRCLSLPKRAQSYALDIVI
ncbi:uncharacterized protein EV420DRAFT_1764263 [Desarmillaria tabescens]|uniref:Uncharacterized protein n=1 Tax=Armillaria tabescens TaxID=1929756 RepID=A0AA39N584_ARMTA|nr:uncharacterized protein EV420DRAFT_1764263 [Desarmillaria tabescens]KAK0458626.1 hypothetical protein EV420DRAFT_1764263 [Desarmillaria tabescens]